MPAAALAVTRSKWSLARVFLLSERSKRMRFFNPKSALAGATALLFVVACGGNNAGQSPGAGTNAPGVATTQPGGSTGEPVVTLAPDQTTGTAGETTAAPDATAAPEESAQPSAPAWTQIGA